MCDVFGEGCDVGEFVVIRYVVVVDVDLGVCWQVVECYDGVVYVFGVFIWEVIMFCVYIGYEQCIFCKDCVVKFEGYICWCMFE